jgi:hypothetical protein
MGRSLQRQTRDMLHHRDFEGEPTNSWQQGNDICGSWELMDESCQNRFDVYPVLAN